MGTIKAVTLLCTGKDEHKNFLNIDQLNKLIDDENYSVIGAHWDENLMDGTKDRLTGWRLLLKK